MPISIGALIQLSSQAGAGGADSQPHDVAILRCGHIG
jgi:hypothetical protein